ncbi:hypothetical protein [endosymbiont GvMRE of Glomus versiforme]|uniref:hypothetical protein n=1 Tax=endosymbiont GvMRE of Glomus versiforme TaxID=2039283 RepID=UPI000EBAA5D3|nr:hypothetical protein [endosymbiont GvMRE of Glomus versiforme]RHZ36703.1 hypothetical protein GvMRE_I2g61 [endosymbiont GvMRE of Glomus versiforme]
MKLKKAFKVANEKDQKDQKNTFFTIIPATEKAKDYILELKKANEDLQDIVIQQEKEIENLKKKLSKYETIK